MVSSIHKQKGAVTQSDIAAMFGVSRVTVSRALRHAGKVGSKLEAAIVEAARTRGYSHEAHFSARDMRLRRDGRRAETNVICVLTAVGAGALNGSPFHVRYVTGIERAAKSSGDEVILATEWAPKHGFPRVVVRGQVDGFIWMPSEQDLQAVGPSCPIPAVTLFFAVPWADVVAVDDHGAMRAMGEYLARKGHRRVAFIGPESELARARLGGLRAGLAGAGGSVSDEDTHMERYVMLPANILPLVRWAMERWRSLPEPERFTAIAAYNDYIAWTVMRCLRDEYRLRVPQDMSVTGFDALDSGDGAFPQLTTAAMPLEELGAEAVRMIDWRMRNQGEERRRVALPSPLVEGGSVGVAK
jgi:DNA-binding LacI/PurR family transcriptional regulator